MENYKINIVETIKLLTYKENPSSLEKIDFEDDNVFLEPLLFAYFNSKKDNLFYREMLTEIMQGYFVEKEPLLIKESFNKQDFLNRFFDCSSSRFNQIRLGLSQFI